VRLDVVNLAGVPLLPSRQRTAWQYDHGLDERDGITLPLSLVFVTNTHTHVLYGGGDTHTYRSSHTHIEIVQANKLGSLTQPHGRASLVGDLPAHPPMDSLLSCTRPWPPLATRRWLHRDVVGARGVTSWPVGLLQLPAHTLVPSFPPMPTAVEPESASALGSHYPCDRKMNRGNHVKEKKEVEGGFCKIKHK
jgi:hypothetical protein